MARIVATKEHVQVLRDMAKRLRDLFNENVEATQTLKNAVSTHKDEMVFGDSESIEGVMDGIVQSIKQMQTVAEELATEADNAADQLEDVMNEKVLEKAR